MRGFLGGISKIALGVCLAVVTGCGSASNNDQGVSFVLTGWYPQATTSINSTGVTGIYIPLAGSGYFNGSFTSGDGGVGGAINPAIGFQNNILGQGIRLQRVFFSYYIHGSSLQPPSTSAALGGVLGTTGQSDPPSSLPPAFLTLPNFYSAEVAAVPPAIRQWIIFNKDQLPELPFDMDVTAYGTGLTTSGDRLDTNESLLTVTIVDDVTINEGSGSSSSAGAETSGVESSTDTDSETETGGEDITDEVFSG